MDAILDFLFHLTEWLRNSTHLPEFALWVTDWPFAIWLQDHFLAIPSFQTIHILSIAALFGSVLMLNLRVLGLIGRDQSLADAFRRYRPWMWWSLASLVTSGVVLLISEPVRNMVNSVFWIKMMFLLVAVVVSLWYQRAVKARMDLWEVSPAGHASIRAGAVLLIVLWMMVMVGGRWIAYSPN
jgi:uncharacterized membrane protein